MTHAYVPLALAVGLGPRLIPPRLAICGAVLAMVPDIDVLTFKLGIAYGSPYGHRGVSHSLGFATLLALVAARGYRWLQSTPLRAFCFLSLATASHGILDLFTNGGLGIALIWPWSDTRFFAPLRIIEASPIGVWAFLTDRGLSVLRSELLVVWLPLTFLAAFLAGWRYLRSHRGSAL